MKFAPHIGLSSPDDFMFPTLAGSDPIDQIKFIAERGFSGIEDNFLKLRPVEVQEKIGKELAKHDLEMGVFVNNLIFDRPTFVSESTEAREVLLQQLSETIEVATRVNGKYVTTLSGILDPNLERDYQTANMIENLKYCAELAESAGITLGLEAVNSSTSRPMIPPPRYKMAIVTWIAIFVLIVIINLLFGSFLASLPMLLRSLLLTVGLVSLMTYIVMPRMTRLFSWWLYPKKQSSRSNS